MQNRRTPEERRLLREKPTQLRQRKHVEIDERHAFLKATSLLKPKRQIFCEVIFYTGCRIQEAHELCPYDFKVEQSRIAFECLKLREDGIFREVPVPRKWITRVVKILELDHLDPYECVWDFCLRTGARSIEKAMKAAGINGSYANARGLRHSYCTLHAYKKTEPQKLQDWVGHRNLKTTFRYIGKVEAGEREAAKVIWK